MIPSIDYLTCVLAGAILLAAYDAEASKGRFVLALLGLSLFIFGTVRAFMSALGL
jgi:hypothetical protein